MDKWLLAHSNSSNEKSEPLFYTKLSGWENNLFAKKTTIK